ncbi:hypothetical protein [Psychrobacter sp. HII-4]|uniref:hypothetical protein n=1 Tax=Psychrobacter sp. HII-4 TaxID=1569264 RepID=UPI001917ECED|nr:hypothetical protein [Psychrobacter sp. HII-4]
MKLMKHIKPYSWLLYGAVFGSVVCYFFKEFLLSQDSIFINDIFKVLIPLYGILLGFLLTLIAIVVSLAGTRLVSNLIRTNHYSNLLTNSKLLALLYFITLIISVIGLFVRDNQSLVFIIVIFLSIVLVFYSLRTAYKFFQIFHNIKPEV